MKILKSKDVDSLLRRISDMQLMICTTLRGDQMAEFFFLTGGLVAITEKLGGTEALTKVRDAVEKKAAELKIGTAEDADEPEKETDHGEQ